jgi:hypothetical protein
MPNLTAHLFAGYNFNAEAAILRACIQQGEAIWVSAAYFFSTVGKVNSYVC